MEINSYQFREILTDYFSFFFYSNISFIFLDDRICVCVCVRVYLFIYIYI